VPAQLSSELSIMRRFRASEGFLKDGLRQVNDEKSTTGIINKKHMAQAFCQGS
jgi:hypothetical protein